jgi:hypothetical protein
MELQIYIDHTDLELERLKEISPLILKSISDWISQQKLTIRLLSNPTAGHDKEQDKMQKNDLAAEKLGIHIQVKSKFKLKDPLNFLYTIAKTYKCEFIIAMVDSDSGDLEEVCYFGNEEGRPDLFEIANYLSL